MERIFGNILHVDCGCPASHHPGDDYGLPGNCLCGSRLPDSAKTPLRS